MLLVASKRERERHFTPPSVSSRSVYLSFPFLPLFCQLSNLCFSPLCFLHLNFSLFRRFVTFFFLVFRFSFFFLFVPTICLFFGPRHIFFDSVAHFFLFFSFSASFISPLFKASNLPFFPAFLPAASLFFPSLFRAACFLYLPLQRLHLHLSS